MEKQSLKNEKLKKEYSVAINIRDFHLVDMLGEGSFGKVFLGRHNKNGVYLAIKIISKYKLFKSGNIKQVITEKQILDSVKFTFITYLEYCFQDNSNLYLVQPYWSGGELYMHLKKVGRFTENVARFIISQVVLAVEYLHSLDVIHRDLKPENIVFDKDGYIKIIDLGLSKKVNNRTYTLCGTPEYFAPEIINGKGYGKSVDWWAIGVLLYELITGRTPFVNIDSLETIRLITSANYHLPKGFSQDLLELEKGLLQQDVTKRLGNLKGGSKDVKNHKFFFLIDWSVLLLKRYDSPYFQFYLYKERAKFYTPITIPTEEENLYADLFKEFGNY